jgi:hypothetical protein
MQVKNVVAVLRGLPATSLSLQEAARGIDDLSEDQSGGLQT